MRRARSRLSMWWRLVMSVAGVLSGPEGGTKDGLVEADHRDQVEFGGNAVNGRHIGLWRDAATRRLGDADVAASTQDSVDAPRKLADRQAFCTSDVEGAAARRVEQHRPQPVCEIPRVQVAAKRRAIALDLEILVVHCCSDEVADRKMLVERKMGSDESKATRYGDFQPRSRRGCHCP